MQRVEVALLRGVCQTPAYVAHDLHFFANEGIDARITLQPTAWIVPQQLAAGALQFAVIPWTRVVASSAGNEDLVAVCGSGCEEAALVVRKGIELDEIETLAVPQEGGMKDLTAAAVLKALDWTPRKTLRLPSGDAAILALVGHAADAASMVEPYATMLEDLGIARVVKRTSDVWPGAPGCSLTTSRSLLHSDPDLVRRFVAAFVRGAQYVHTHPAESAVISGRYIGVHERFIRRAFLANRPNVSALSNEAAMKHVIDFMYDLGYLNKRPTDSVDLRFLFEIAPDFRSEAHHSGGSKIPDVECMPECKGAGHD